MREMLFTAKRPDNGEWVEGNIIEDGVTGQMFVHASGNSVNESDRIGEEWCLKFLAFEAVPETVCRYTGLTGRHAEKIWEGDIVRNNDYEVGVVKFGNYNDSNGYGDSIYGYYIEWLSESGKKLKKNIAFWIEHNFIEVVGNIFDNPELLGGDSD